MNWQCRNAMRCTTDGCTAHDEIEALREKVAGLTVERDELLGPNPVEQMLREQLAAMTKERDDHIGLTHMALDERDEYLRQLDAMTKLWENEYRLRCEAQAREKVLIEAAQAVVDRWESPLWKVQESTASFIYTLQKALALPQDSSALDRRLQEEYERGYDMGCTDSTREGVK